MTSVQSNDQRLLDRILDDQRRRLAPDQGRDDVFTYFAADKALQDRDLDTDEIMDGIVDGAHDCGIDGIWSFVDDRYVTADAHQYLSSRAGIIELVVLQAKTSPGYQESVFEKLHFHLPTLLDMGRDEDDSRDHTNAKLLERTRRFLRILEDLATSFPQVKTKVIHASKAAEGPHPHVKSKGDRLRRELEEITFDTEPKDADRSVSATCQCTGPTGRGLCRPSLAHHPFQLPLRPLVLRRRRRQPDPGHDLMGTVSSPKSPSCLPGGAVLPSFFWS